MKSSLLPILILFQVLIFRATLKTRRLKYNFFSTKLEWKLAPHVFGFKLFATQLFIVRFSTKIRAVLSGFERAILIKNGYVLSMDTFVILFPWLYHTWGEITRLSRTQIIILFLSQETPKQLLLNFLLWTKCVYNARIGLFCFPLQTRSVTST